MKIKLFALDDNQKTRKLIEKNFKSYNSKTRDDVEVDVSTFSNAKDFFEAMNDDVDLCILDIDLGVSDIDGFDVGRKVHSKYKNATFIISSSDIDADEDCETFMSKVLNINFASEVVSKYLHIKRNKILNFAELLFRQDHYRHAT